LQNKAELEILKQVKKENQQHRSKFCQLALFQGRRPLPSQKNASIGGAMGYGQWATFFVVVEDVLDN